jgi:hypothetical protein
MKTRKSAFLLGAVLFAAALPCSPQSDADRQQQIASHARQAQAYLKVIAQDGVTAGISRGLQTLEDDGARGVRVLLK